MTASCPLPTVQRAETCACICAFDHEDHDHEDRDCAHRVADWFAQLNNKMGGDLKKIQIVGQYMIEIWKAVGMERIGDKVYTGHNALGLFLLSN
jgi:hypothetical protein